MATRQQESERRAYNLVRLHLEDVLAIEETIQSLAEEPATVGNELEVSNSTWQAGSVQELVDQETGQGPFDEFKIVGNYRTRISVWVDGSAGGQLWVGDTSDLAVRGAYERIDGILRGARLSWPIRVFASAYCGALAGAVFALGFLIIAVGVAFDLIEDPKYVSSPLTTRNVVIVVGGARKLNSFGGEK